MQTQCHQCRSISFFVIFQIDKAIAVESPWSRPSFPQPPGTSAVIETRMVSCREALPGLLLKRSLVKVGVM